MRSMVYGTLVSLSAVLLTQGASASDWPQFRGPAGTATAAEASLPLRWSTTENVRWQVDLPGRGLSCPIISGGRVFLTACSGYKQRRLHVLCLSAETGAKLWERQLAATGSTMCHPTSCMAAPTPCTDGTHVYTLFATGDLAAFDFDGNLLWYRALESDYPNVSNQVGLAASPIVWHDWLFLGMENAVDSFAAAIDIRTGQNRWKVARPRGINWATPQILQTAEQTAVLFETGSEVTAYEPATGRVLWKFPGSMSSTVGPLTVEGKVLAAGNEFLALEPTAGALTPRVIWKSPRLHTNYASALHYRGRIYTINGSNILSSASAADGKIIWQQRLKGRTYWASPVAADGRIYVVSEDGITTVFEAGGETAKVLGTNSLPDTILATPAIADGAIFLRSDQHLYCISTKKSG